MKNFSWVVDRAKFEAACAECGVNGTEAQIKAAYVKKAGLVRGADKDDWKKGVETPEVAPETPEEIEAPEAPKKKGKK
jgi:hypothetical protein